MTLGQLAERIDARLEPAEAADRPVRACNTLMDAGPDEISFLTNPRYVGHLARTEAAAVIVDPRAAAELDRPRLIADDPYYAFRNAAVALHGFREHPIPADGPVSRHARVHPDAAVGDRCIIHDFATVAAGAVLRDGCVLYPGVFVGPEARIGEGCILYPSVAVYDRCVLGDRVTLHAGCVIGQDGFGYATHDGEHHKIPTPGNVVIEDDVEMGAGCAIDRATLGSTVIGRGTKFSNHVTIGHGARVGRYNLYVAQVGLAGSVTTGDYVVIGGQVGVAGHLTIGHRVQVAAKSGVMNDLPDDAVVGGQPAQPLAEAKRAFLAGQKVPDLLRRLKKLERDIAALTEKSDGGG